MSDATSEARVFRAASLPGTADAPEGVQRHAGSGSASASIPRGQDHLPRQDHAPRQEQVSRHVKAQEAMANKVMREGLGHVHQGDGVRDLLALRHVCDDGQVAFALARMATRSGVAVRLPKEAAQVPPYQLEEEREASQPVAKADPYDDIESLDDLRTLTALVQVGPVRRRRAALLRLGRLLSQSRPGPADKVREAVAVIAGDRSVELVQDRVVVQRWMAKGSGAKFPERGERMPKEEWQKLVQSVERQVQSFWDGEGHEEPFRALPSDKRAELLTFVRDLPDPLVWHICAVLESGDNLADPSTRWMLLTSLRYVGDPRLVPSLASVLEGKETEARMEAARVLAHIEDPMVRGLLARAYGRAVIDKERIVIAGALGSFGDRRGLEYVRYHLEEGDVATRQVALEALGHLGTRDDVDSVLALLQSADASLAPVALRVLALIGDRRVIPVLMRLRDQTQVSRLHAEIEETFRAIRLRMELLGEEPSARDDVSIIEPLWSERARSKSDDPFVTRVRARTSFLLGYLWLSIGMTRLAMRRFETAAMLRKRWAQPLLAMAIHFSRFRKDTLALSEFRRAREADRFALEASPMAMRMMAAVYLRRADVVERQGRLDIACRMLEEILSLDLRRVPATLRFEIERRQVAIRRQLGRRSSEGVA